LQRHDFIEVIYFFHHAARKLRIVKSSRIRALGRGNEPEPFQLLPEAFMIKKILVAALAVASVGAHASLANLAPWDNGAYFIAHGLVGVQFSTTAASTGGGFVAMGAHPYTSGVTMPNDGVNQFDAPSGLTTPTRAAWSFDFAYNVGSCSTCNVFLDIDIDASSGINYQTIQLFDGTTAIGDGALAGGGRGDSWNMKFNFINGGAFDAGANSNTNFQIRMVDATGATIAGSNIDVNVPEPGSLALVGVALAGVGFARRRKA
jgi:hypothetical protein